MQMDNDIETCIGEKHEVRVTMYTVRVKHTIAKLVGEKQHLVGRGDITAVEVVCFEEVRSVKVCHASPAPVDCMLHRDLGHEA